MARMLFPDLSDSQYAHSLWNAMNLLESRAALRAMHRWDSVDHQVEVPPADVILLDGAVAPNDRDASHYGQPDSYGRFVRDLIDVSSSILQRSRDDNQVIAGAVKNAQLRVLGPVINYYIQQVVATEHSTQIRSWPLQTMNALPDQHLLTRVLTAMRQPREPWMRTCLVLRPFHAVTDFSDRYSRQRRPSDELIHRAQEAKGRLTSGQSTFQDEFWAGGFDPMRDSFLKMLEGAWYAMFFLGSLPRLDHVHTLPRIEMLIPAPTTEEGDFWDTVQPFSATLLGALREMGFEVAAEHDRFRTSGRLDIMPRLLIDVHNTVKQWAALLYARAQEHIAFQIGGFLKNRRRHARIRPWRKHELEAWLQQMTRDRERRLSGRASAVETEARAAPKDGKGL